MARKKTKRTPGEAAPADAHGAKDRADRGAPPDGDPFTLLMDLLAGQVPVAGEVLGHLRKAQLEFLKALRLLMDKQIERLEAQTGAERPARVRKVPVE